MKRPYIYERYDELIAIKRTRPLEEDEAIELAEVSGTIQALEVERDYLNGECSIGGHYYNALYDDLHMEQCEQM